MALSMQAHSLLCLETSSPVLGSHMSDRNICLLRAQEEPWFPVVSRKPQEWPVIMALRKAPAFWLIYPSSHLNYFSIHSSVFCFIPDKTEWRGRKDGRKCICSLSISRHWHRHISFLETYLKYGSLIDALKTLGQQKAFDPLLNAALFPSFYASYSKDELLGKCSPLSQLLTQRMSYWELLYSCK